MIFARRFEIFFIFFSARGIPASDRLQNNLSGGFIVNSFWKKVAGSLALTMLVPFGAMAAEDSISFNKAPADILVEATDGIVDEELAKAIVDYREKNGPFKTASDLRKVPGMTAVTFGMLGPVEDNGDVVYEAEIPTGMHSY